LNWGKGVQAPFDPPEVVLLQPVAGERLRGCQLDALRPIVDELLARPARRGDAPAEVLDLISRNLDVKRTDLDGRLDGAAHGPPLLVPQSRQRPQ
jgi:hypothetical protein